MRNFLRARLQVLAIILFIMTEVLVYLFANYPVFDGYDTQAGDRVINNNAGSGEVTDGFIKNMLQPVSENDTSAEPVMCPDPSDGPYMYDSVGCEYSGHISKVHILEVDPDAMEGYRLQAVLASDSIFGFEYLSSMADRTGAAAAVTGGFFSTYGEPSGMVVINSRVLKKATGTYPVLVIKNNEACFEQTQMTVHLSAAGLPRGIRERVAADHINTRAKADEIIVYTPEFGSNNRVAEVNTTLVIKNNEICGKITSQSDTPIPSDGFLVTFMGVYHDSYFEKKGFVAGAEIKLEYGPKGFWEQAYECGCWIVRNGLDVTTDSDPWIGVLTNRDPRTAVGLKEDGTLVFIVVDGRQPGYSEGFTVKELASFLLGYGVTDAAMLDGGASAEMIVEGRIVNRPSFKGRERMMGGCIAIIPEDDSMER